MKVKITLDLDLEVKPEDLEADDENNEGIRETVDELARRIHELLRNEYMKGGDSLYGYEGPFVTKITSATLINPEE
jgi:hypothetical protein